MFSGTGRFLRWNRGLRHFVVILAIIKISAYLVVAVTNARKSFRSIVFVCKYATLIACQRNILANETEMREILQTLQNELLESEKVCVMYSS